MGMKPLSIHSWLPPVLVVHWQRDKVGRVEGRTPLVCPSSPKVTSAGTRGFWLPSSLPLVPALHWSSHQLCHSENLGCDLWFLSQVISAPSWWVCCLARSTLGRAHDAILFTSVLSWSVLWACKRSPFKFPRRADLYLHGAQQTLWSESLAAL